MSIFQTNQNEFILTRSPLTIPSQKLPLHEFQMPVNQPMKGFDPKDENSWFFGFLSRADATDLLLASRDIGTFLVRESTTAKGDLVLSIKEKEDKVSHYIINRILSEQSQQVQFKIGQQVFRNIPQLLDHYKNNDLDDTPLSVPAKPTDRLSNRRSFTRDYLANANAEVPVTGQDPIICSHENQFTETKSRSLMMNRKLPLMARVIQSRIPNAYDKTALTLKVGDLVRVTKMDISGCWEGEVAGRKGHFPFNYVSLIEDTSIE